MSRLRSISTGELQNAEELICCNSFSAMIYPCEKHEFDKTRVTQPGLAMSPRELLNRVENGLVEVNAVFRGMENDDNDPDNYPDEVVDLASVGELIHNGSEYLKSRKEQLEQEQAEIDSRLDIKDVKDDEKDSIKS